MTELLARRLTVDYGGITAVWELDLAVRSGTVVAVLGRNGAGKSTTLHALAGLLPARGSILLDGEEMRGLPAYQRVARGLALVQEGKQVFRHLTVEENLVLGAYSRRQRRSKTQTAVDRELERFPILADRRNDRAGALSGGQQQMLAIAQALLAEPKVLMLDEPSAGLAPAVVADVFETIGQLAASGIGVLLVEQLADRAVEIADEVLVIDVGRLVLRHDTREGGDPQVLMAAYFGRQ